MAAPSHAVADMLVVLARMLVDVQVALLYGVVVMQVLSRMAVDTQVVLAHISLGSGRKRAAASQRAVWVQIRKTEVARQMCSATVAVVVASKCCPRRWIAL